MAGPASSICFAAAILWPLATVTAQQVPARQWIPQLLGAQVTVIAQYLPPFPALYNGPNSLTNGGALAATHTYGAYFGARLPAGFQGYLDLEMARGAAVGNALGLAGVTNGDVIRQGSVNLGQGLYLARGFVRYVVGLAPGRDTVARAMDQLSGPAPTARLEVSVGKLALTDAFDQNRYANSTRTQFCDWALFNNSAWDYAADTRGYSYGAIVGWIEPRWALRIGRFLMPTFANGNVFDWDIRRAHGDNLELDLRPNVAGTVLRLLAYENHGRMGIYREALARAQAAGQLPDIVADDAPGRRKYGFGLNLEQPLADSGETGLFLRAGWNDGATEDFVFTEVDRQLSAGLQATGTSWGRAADRLGVAVVVHGLSAAHSAYLAAGGKGFLLGDGRLNYGGEEILEAYYRFQVGPHVGLGPGSQVIAHPGYNRDRGPATVFSLRLNVRY